MRAIQSATSKTQMMRIVDIPLPKDAQLNWSQAAPVDWSIFLKLLPLDWLLWLTGGCWEDSLDPMLKQKTDLELKEEEM